MYNKVNSIKDLSMQKYINCLRAKHYIKNILILIPAIFSKKLLDITALPDIAWGILSFCALSSVIYIFNDLCDMPHDQKHPTKQNRPIASGAISPKAAIVIMLLLLVVVGIPIIFLAVQLFYLGFCFCYIWHKTFYIV